MLFMDSSSFRNWRVLCWNVCGLNSEARQRDVRAKIEESQCSIVCLQETKCSDFDIRAIRRFCPLRFDNFAFAPSVGASGGILVVWNSSIFKGQLIEIQSFGVVVSFTSVHNAKCWTLVSVYGPCEGQPRDDFVGRLYHLNIPPDEQWLLLGISILLDLLTIETCRAGMLMISSCSMRLLDTLASLSYL